MSPDYRLYIDGAFRDAAAGGTIGVIDPARGREFARVAYGGREDARLAIAAAARAFGAWRDANVYDRAVFLHRVAGLMRSRSEALAETLTREVGKPLAESRVEVLGSAATLEWSAETAKRDYGEFIPPGVNDKRIFTLRSPVGVVAGIAPWNFPLMLLCRKLGPALAVGCAFVGRAASQTPRATMEMFGCIHEAGLPPGVANLITGPSGEQGDEFARNPAVKKISFTGSTEVGRQLMAAAAPQVKKLSLELGGHAPLIVCPDADLPRAAAVAVKAKFRNMGQTCIAPSRFYAPRDKVSAFAEAAAGLASALKIGNGLSAGVDVGPLIDELRLAATEALVDDIKSKGGKVLCGGKRPAGFAEGYFYEPTVVVGVTDEMLITQEEPFAPILPVIAYDTVDEAIARANDTVYGLAAYAVTNDMALMFKLADRLEAGVIGINEVAPATPQAPFGGMKQSGLGREGGRQVLDAYTEVKMVSVVL